MYAFGENMLERRRWPNRGVSGGMLLQRILKLRVLEMPLSAFSVVVFFTRNQCYILPLILGCKGVTALKQNEMNEIVDKSNRLRQVYQLLLSLIVASIQILLVFSSNIF